jgi:hypothetical protein
MNSFGSCSVSFRDFFIEDNLLGKLEIQDLLMDKGYYPAYPGDEADIEMHAYLEADYVTNAHGGSIKDEIVSMNSIFHLNVFFGKEKISIKKKAFLYFEGMRRSRRIMKKLFRNLPHCDELTR